MATAKITAMYARSGYNAYTGTNTSAYLAIGYFQASIFPAYTQFSDGKTYRGCIGFDFSSLAGASISQVKLYTRGSDNLGVGTSQWTMQLSRSNQWSHTTLATVTASGTNTSGQWYCRTITSAAFLSAIEDLGGVGYIHVTQSSSFKLSQGLTDSSSTWPYVEVIYTKPEPEPVPPTVETITVSNFAVERCVFNADTETYEPSPYGAYARFSLSASLLTSGEYSDNELSVDNPPIITIRQVGSELTTQITDFWTSGTSVTISNQMISGTFTPDTTWFFELTITDLYQSVTVQVRIGATHPPVHIPKNGNGVAIGGYSQSSENEQRFDCYFPAYFHGGILGGLLTGRVDNTNVTANSYSDVNISFGKTFDTAPAVIVTPESSSTGVNMGSVSFVVVTGSITTTGFKVRIYNNTNNQRGLAFRWLAI